MPPLPRSGMEERVVAAALGMKGRAAAAAALRGGREGRCRRCARGEGEGLRRRSARGEGRVVGSARGGGTVSLHTGREEREHGEHGMCFMEGDGRFLEMLNFGVSSQVLDSPVGKQEMASTQKAFAFVKAKSTKGLNWSTKEDELSVEAWLHTSLDVVIGADQSANSIGLSLETMWAQKLKKAEVKEAARTARYG
ncbi:hypothetical protein D1007_41333 [Hordeum vulgare]|nr:hypothetical protein D1007_41333 [Hordeum vulgare]